jgi:RNA polymerase sigma factor (sigma-70 family)
MRQPATATVKGEKKIDGMDDSWSVFVDSALAGEKLLLAALDWLRLAEFHGSKSFSELKLSLSRPVLLSHVLPQVLTLVQEPLSTARPAPAESGFAALVDQHAPMVFRTLLRLLGTREGLDDLAQDCFLRLYRALPSFRGDAMISTYLYRIVVNVAQDELRRRHREERPLTSIADETEDWGDRLRHPSPNAEEQLLEREFAAGVERALGELSAIQRTVLVLYHQEERTYEEIAKVLNMPIGTVRTHLHRARKRLRELISESPEDSQRREAAR